MYTKKFPLLDHLYLTKQYVFHCHLTVQMPQTLPPVLGELLGITKTIMQQLPVLLPANFSAKI